MAVKKSYSVGDTVWIYGISPKNNKLIQGKVLKELDLSDVGYTAGPYYIIEIPSHIDPLLEIRTWDTMSQDNKGPVGMFRSIGKLSSTIKRSGQVGFAYDEDYVDEEIFADDDIDPRLITAALEKSQKDQEHAPLNLKQQPAKTKRRYYKKKNQ